ncbi:MAG: sugar transferase [Nitrososphaerales archaeon]
MYLNKICDQEDFPVVAIPVPRWKRLLDVTIILLTTPILLPLMLAVAVLVRIVSKGPTLFRQERVGYLGQRFMCFKFRTMFVNSDTAIHQGHLDHLMDSDAPLVKMDAKGDPRIIPFGSLSSLRIRKISAMAKGTVQHIARIDRALAGVREE